MKTILLFSFFLGALSLGGAGMWWCWVVNVPWQLNDFGHELRVDGFRQPAPPLHIDCFRLFDRVNYMVVPRSHIVAQILVTHVRFDTGNVEPPPRNLEKKYKSEKK